MRWAVTIDEAKAIALTLVRAGAGIKAVRRFRDAGGAKTRLVQIGADSRILGQRDLTVGEVARELADRFLFGSEVEVHRGQSS